MRMSQGTHSGAGEAQGVVQGCSNGPQQSYSESQISNDHAKTTDSTWLVTLRIFNRRLS